MAPPADKENKAGKPGVLLVNLGSPDSTEVEDVRRYLRQFLMDGRVLDAPTPIRWFIVNCLILPKRPKDSAEAYEAIWTEQGSPLVVTSKRVTALLQDRVEFPVELAMRYQNPSIEHAISELKSKGVTDLVVVPLFPHYAGSSYESAVERVEAVVAEHAPWMRVAVVPPYFNEANYIEALTASASEHLSGNFGHLLFSFHGIPEHHLKLADPTKQHCLVSEDCCAGHHPVHATCYRAQCLKTVQAFVTKLGLTTDQYSVAFQSRLGRKPWLKPYTDKVVEALPARGIKKLVVICPAFVSDCLETLEEIGIRAREDFVKAGGKNLTLIPCMNEHPRWIEALENYCRSHLAELQATTGVIAG